MSEICLGNADDIPEGGMVQVYHNDNCILLCRTDGEVYAVEGICPHRGAQLVQGCMEDGIVVCPWHDWGFDVRTGGGVTNPMSKLKTFAVDVRDGMVYIAE